MRRFLQMLLAVLFCTTAMCTYDCFANTGTSKAQKANSVKLENALKSETTVQNSNEKSKATTENKTKGAYSDEEVYLAAQLIYHEAHNQSYNGKAAIAEIVLNRLNSSLFPDTVEEVIYQSGQFTSARSLKKIEPTEQELRIAYNVLNGRLKVLNDDDVLYFKNPTITNGISAKLEKDWGALDYYTYIGDHAFYSQDINVTHEEVAAGKADDNTEDKEVTKTAKADEKKTSIFEKIPGALHNIADMFTSKKNKTAKAADNVDEASDANSADDNSTNEETVSEDTEDSELLLESAKGEEAASQEAAENGEAMAAAIPVEHLLALDVAGNPVAITENGAVSLEHQALLNAYNSQNAALQANLAGAAKNHAVMMLQKSTEVTDDSDEESDEDTVEDDVEEADDDTSSDDEKTDETSDDNEDDVDDTSSDEADEADDSDEADDESEEESDDTDNSLSVMAVNANAAALNAQMMKADEDNKTQNMSEAEKELAKLDEDDPLAIARRQIIESQKAEVEVKARIEAENIKARERAEAQARGFNQAIVDKAALDRAEYARATQSAIALVNGK